ncbi:MAG: hypothetical protein MPJ50_10510 [Pirellulales bacterium]|nr:hypothetical protein [Pirellulales bacterium]
MSVEMLREFLLWCTVCNVGLLVWWFAFMVLAHDMVYEMHTRWFKISRETFDAIHYSGLAALKIIIWVFNIIPYVTLWAIT